MPVTLRANAELVMVAWIESIPGFTPNIAGTQLPADDTTWANTGFITVSIVGGSPDVDVPVRKPVMQIDCWACTPGSNMPPWLQASGLAEQVRDACYDKTAFGRELRPTINGLTYPTAKATTVYVLTEPRRVYDDLGDYARYQMDVALSWIQLDR
jgi:hypothetical protein